MINYRALEELFLLKLPKGDNAQAIVRRATKRMNKRIKTIQDEKRTKLFRDWAIRSMIQS